MSIYGQVEGTKSSKLPEGTFFGQEVFSAPKLYRETYVAVGTCFILVLKEEFFDLLVKEPEKRRKEDLV